MNRRRFFQLMGAGALAPVAAQVAQAIPVVHYLHGHGKIDDTDALQALIRGEVVEFGPDINVSGAGWVDNSTLVFPKGIYRVSSSLVFNKGRSGKLVRFIVKDCAFLRESGFNDYIIKLFDCMEGTCIDGMFVEHADKYGLEMAKSHMQGKFNKAWEWAFRPGKKVKYSIYERSIDLDSSETWPIIDGVRIGTPT